MVSLGLLQYLLTLRMPHTSIRECAGIDWHLENNEGIAQANTLHVGVIVVYHNFELYEEYTRRNHICYTWNNLNMELHM